MRERAHGHCGPLLGAPTGFRGLHDCSRFVRRADQPAVREGLLGPGGSAGARVTTDGVRLVVCGASGVWDELVAADSRATPFHDWSFLRDIAARSGWRFRPLLAVALSTGHTK